MKAMPWSVGRPTMEVAAMKDDTLKKLKAMRLPAFAEAYQMQNDREPEYQSMSFHERLMLLVDAEYDSRHNNNIKRLVKNAGFSEPSAFLGNIDYLPDRHLDRGLLESLADNDYIQKGLDVILIGATGSGKSFIANALGINACQSGCKTRYVRLPELFSELEAARIQGQYQKVMRQFQKLSLMILDEFLLIPSSDQEQRDLLELMEYRCGHASTIFCSQFMPEGWHGRLGGSALADSILDRIIPSAYMMRIDGDVSMRQRKRPIKD